MTKKRHVIFKQFHQTNLFKIDDPLKGFSVIVSDLKSYGELIAWNSSYLQYSQIHSKNGETIDTFYLIKTKSSTSIIIKESSVMSSILALIVGAALMLTVYIFKKQSRVQQKFVNIATEVIHLTHYLINILK